MALAFLVYAAGVLSKLTPFFVILAVLLVLFTIALVIAANDGKDEFYHKRMKKAMASGIAAGFSLFIAFLIPSEKTVYIMAGAYATQQIAENPNVQRFGGKIVTIIDQKLDGIIDEGIEEAKKATGKVAEAAKEKAKEVATDVVTEKAK